VPKNSRTQLTATLAAVACLVSPNRVSRPQERPAFLDPTRPSVYVTEAVARRGQSEQDGRAMKWLRLRNNCRWTILLPAVRGDQSGDRLFYRVFRDEDIVTPVSPPPPRWSVPSRPVTEPPVASVPRFAGRYWSDAPATESVAPGEYVDFRVAADETAGGLVILVPFYYQWESRAPPKPELEPMHFARWSAEQSGLKITR
jgi:hypothetical protein